MYLLETHRVPFTEKHNAVAGPGGHTPSASDWLFVQPGKRQASSWIPMSA